jgi:hypothetical protein
MSLYNLNPENRNSMNITTSDSTNRSRNLINIIRSARRCCSFCRLPDHTVNWCNDQRIYDFENLCLQQKSVFENNELPYQDFENWLVDYYTTDPTIVKVFSVRKCGSTTRSSINTVLNNIVEYFYGEFYDIPELVNESDSNTNTNTNDDFIPFNTNDDFIQFNNLIPIYTRVQNWENIRNLMISVLRPTENYTNLNRKFDITTTVEFVELEDTITQCECNICYETFNITSFVKLNCQHDLCKVCCKKTLQMHRNLQEDPKCGFCRVQIKNLTFKNESDKSEFKDLIV